MSTQEIKRMETVHPGSGSQTKTDHDGADSISGDVDLLFRLNHAGTILDLKVGATDDLLVQREELLGKRIQSIPLKAIGQGFHDAIHKVIVERSVVSIEYSLELRGEARAYEARLVPLPEDEILAIIHNITLRKKAELALAQAEAKYRSIFENASEGIFQTTPDGKFVTANPALARILGFASPEELIRERTDIARQGYVRPERRDEFKRLISGTGMVSGFEYEVHRKDNTVVWVSETARAIHDSHGRIQFYEGFLRDITERKRAEGMHLGQNQILEMIATGAPLNETLTSLARFVESQSEGMLCAISLLDEDGQCLRPGAAPSLPESYSKGIDGLRIGPRVGCCGTAAYRKECVIVTDVEQDPLWAEFREVARRYDFRACWATPILSHHGKVLGTFAMYYRNVRKPSAAETRLLEIAAPIAGIAIERKRAEDDLFQSQQMLRTVLDTIPQRVFWKDRNSVYVGCNMPLARDTGYTDPRQLIGKTDYETQSAVTADLYRADDQDVMATGRAKINYEEPQIKADGSRGWLRTTKVPLRDKDGNVIGILGTYEDITERKHLEEQFRQAQKMEAFGQLAAGVAHDFNNILTIIQGNLSLLRMQLGARNERLPAIDQAIKAAERAANLTRQLLTFSRRQPMQPRDLDLNEVVANMTKMLQRLIGEHIALEARYAPGGAPIQADPGMMEQVLMNLAVNSRDAMSKGGRLIIQTAARVISETDAAVNPRARAGEFIELSVIDTGCGIPPEHLAHIFEPFFTTKEIGKGTGLGLATVFGIVDQHHGWIEVESEPGKGTTFRMFMSRLAQTAAAALAEPRPAPPLPGGTETILIVEDEEAVRELMLALLTQQGYQVHQATSGLSALKVWSEHNGSIDMLLTDMVMPDGVGGRELAERLRSEKPGLKVIYCSGYTDDALGTDSPLRNNGNFLEKPFAPDKFLQRIRTCLDEA